MGEPTRPHNEVTAGPLGWGMVRFAAPLTLAMATNAIYVMTDMYWVGGLGVESVAAVLSSSILTMLSFSLQLGAQTGASALIARRYGAGEVEEARDVVNQALMLSFLASIVIGLAFVVAGRWLFSVALAQSASVTELGLLYLMPLAWGMPLNFLMSQLAAVLQAIGESRKTTAVFLTFSLANIVFDPLLIYGWELGGWSFEGYGVAGAAWATLLGRLLAMLLGIAYLVWGSGAPRQLRVRLRPERPAAAMLAMIKVGMPRFLQFIFVPVSQMLLVGLAASVVEAQARDAVSAALAVCLRLEFVLFLPVFGLSRASQVYIGQNLGARQPERALRAGWIAVVLAALYMGFVSALYVSYPEAILRPFLAARQQLSARAEASTADAPPIDAAAEARLAAEDEEAERVIAFGREYLQTVAWVLAFWGVAIILNASISGAGDTTFPAITMSVLLVPMRYGFAWAASGPYGLMGIWLSIAVTMVLGGLVFVAYFARGRWITVAEARLDGHRRAPARSGPLVAPPRASAKL